MNRTGPRARRLLVGLAAAYLAAVVRITLWPDFASPEQFDALRSAVAWLTARSIPVSYDGVEAAANVVMFVPFGVLGGLLVSRRGRWAVLTAGCATSAAIETSQLLFLPTRVATVQDVVMNTLGVAVGLLSLHVAQTRPAGSSTRRPADARRRRPPSEPPVTSVDSRRDRPGPRARPVPGEPGRPSPQAR